MIACVFLRLLACLLVCLLVYSLVPSLVCLSVRLFWPKGAGGGSELLNGKKFFLGQAKTPESYPGSPRRPEASALGGGEETPFLNAERVEGQGRQNKVYEKSTENCIL